MQLTIGRFELSARIDSLFDGCLLRQRLTTRKAKDLLGAWIDHLMMNCVRPTESILITTTSEKHPVIERFAPPAEDPRALLAALLDFYSRGLAEPLPFFHGARTLSPNGRSIRPKDLLHSKRRRRPGAIRRSRTTTNSDWDRNEKTTISISLFAM